jgi:predicted dehydrogenase
MDTEVRFGLIGLGRHGSRYAKHIMDDVPGARLTAVCRQDEEKGRIFADQHGLSYYADYRELIECPEVDAIAVVVSPDLHPEICRHAVSAGKHILLEKPLARNLGEGQQILKHLSGAEIKFMLAQTLRFNSVVRAIKDRISKLGRIHLMSFNQHMEPLGLTWLDDPVTAGGGNILHTGVHTFDLIHFLTGQSVAWAWCRLDQVYQQRTEDFFAAVFGLENGTRCVVESSKVTAGRSGRIEVIGEKGQLMGDHVLGRLDLIQGYKAVPVETAKPVYTVQKVLKTFVECLLEDLPMPITTADGLRTLEVATMCYRSVETGRVVTAEEVAI